MKTTILDPTVSVLFISSRVPSKHGFIKLQYNDGNTILSFFPPSLKSIRDPAQFPEDVYQFSDFSYIEVDKSDEMKLFFVAPLFKVEIKFDRIEDKDRILTYISNKVNMVHTDFNPYVFLLENSKLDNQNQFLIPILPDVLDNEDQKQVLKLSRIKNDDLEFDYSGEKDKEVKVIDEDMLKNYLDEDGKVKNVKEFLSMLYNKDIDPSIEEFVWKLLLYNDYLEISNEERIEKDNEKRKIYKTILNQWKTTPKRQWINDSNLRKLVEMLEKDIKENEKLFCKFSNVKCAQKMAFDIFLTFSFYRWDDGVYNHEFIYFLIPFMTLYIKEANYEKVIKQNGEVVSFVDAEADIFSMFSSFFKNNKLGDLIYVTNEPFLKKLYQSVGLSLTTFSPEILLLLSQKHVKTLDFLNQDCKSWFGTCFNMQTPAIRRLWVSALSYSDTFSFFTNFLLSYLYSLSSKLIKINPLSHEEFVKRYNLVKTELDLTTLLINLKKIGKESSL